MIISSRTQATGSDLFDPMTRSNLQEPFVFFAKLRQEKPVYWNEQYSFWMLTRYQDVKAVCVKGTSPILVSDRSRNRKAGGADSAKRTSEL